MTTLFTLNKWLDSNDFNQDSQFIIAGLPSMIEDTSYFHIKHAIIDDDAKTIIFNIVDEKESSMNNAQNVLSDLRLNSEWDNYVLYADDSPLDIGDVGATSNTFTLFMTYT